MSGIIFEVRGTTLLENPEDQVYFSWIFRRFVKFIHHEDYCSEQQEVMRFAQEDKFVWRNLVCQILATEGCRVTDLDLYLQIEGIEEQNQIFSWK